MVGQFEKALERHAEVVEDLHHLPGEAALRHLRRALHEHHHVLGGDLVLDGRVGVGHS